MSAPMAPPLKPIIALCGRISATALWLAGPRHDARVSSPRLAITRFALTDTPDPELEPTMEFGMMGYGKYHYKYKSGREGDWIRIGIANNKSYISLYCVGLVGKSTIVSDAESVPVFSIQTRSSMPFAGAYSLTARSRMSLARL